MEFKATPRFIEYDSDYPSQHGNQIYKFRMTVEKEDGQLIEGGFTTTKKEQTKYVVGEQTLMKQGTMKLNYETVPKFDKVSQGGQGGYSGGKGGTKSKWNDPLENRRILAGSCINSAELLIMSTEKMDIVKKDRIAIRTLANKFYEYILNKYGEDKNRLMEVEGRLKRICDYYVKFPELKPSNSTEILSYLDDDIEWIHAKAKG